MRRAPLDPEEQREQERRRAEERDRRQREPVVLARLDERVDEQGEACRDRDRTRHVEAACGILDAALTQQTGCQRDRREADRDVHVEHPLPAEILGEDASEQHPHCASRTRDRTPHAERLVALGTLGEGGREDRERGRRDHRRTEALHGSGADQEPARAREPARERGRDEDAEPDHEEPPPAEQVGRAATEQKESAEGQRIAACDPLQVRGREVERALDRRQRDVDDRDVDHEHELRRAEQSERDPAARIGGGRGHGSFRRRTEGLPSLTRAGGG